METQRVLLQVKESFQRGIEELREIEKPGKCEG